MVDQYVFHLLLSIAVRTWSSVIAIWYMIIFSPLYLCVCIQPFMRTIGAHAVIKHEFYRNKDILTLLRTLFTTNVAFLNAKQKFSY